MPRSRHVISALLAVLSVTAAGVISAVALAVASGTTLQPGSTNSYSTEYLDLRVYALSATLPLVLAVAAGFSVWPALAGSVTVCAIQVWAVEESNARLARDGWGSGLEVLAFLMPLGALLLTGILVMIGWLVGRSRRSQDQ